MITDSPAAFGRHCSGLAELHDPVPRGLFMVEPVDFRLEEDCARDNRYMALDEPADPVRARRQFRELAGALATLGVPTICFPGDPATPDAVFPNNVFATAPGRAIVGSMRHPSRRLEAARRDIRRFFTDVHGYALSDLSAQPCTAELTGSLVIDRGRRIGFCGMTERVDEPGARAMHEAFGLAATLCFELRSGEYHTNVVMSVLAGRALVIEPEACADRAAADAIIDCFDEHLELDRAEIDAFAGNCLAVTAKDLFMSARAADELRAPNRATLERWGFRLHTVDVSELERAGGSVRCMLGELY